MLGTNRTRPTNIIRSTAQKESFFGAVRRRTLICWRNVQISASSITRDRIRSTTIQPMSLQRSLIAHDHHPILDRLPSRIRFATGTSEDRVTHSGRHWQFSDAAIAPRPLRAPRPPIIIGAQVDAAIARAAKIGDGWLSVPITTLDQLDAQMSVFQSARSATKLPPAEHFCRLLEVGCAADDDTAIRRSAPFLMEKYKSYASWGLEGLTLDPNAAPEQQFRALASKRFAVGAAASVLDML